MNMDKYIAELLYDFECVTIPGFGAFIANDRPARINRINHQFKPPFRGLIFNVQLQSNDGLLVNQLASSEGVSFEKAKSMIDLYVKTCYNDLALGKILHFENIGRLFYDENQHIVFQQDEKTNYYAPVYGLTGFVSPPVKRVEAETNPIGFILSDKTPKQKAVDRKPGQARSDKPKKRKLLLPLMAAMLLLLLGFGWTVTHQQEAKDYLANTASLLPFFHSEPALYSPRTVAVVEPSAGEYAEEQNSDLVAGDVISEENSAMTLEETSAAEVEAEPLVAETPEAGEPEISETEKVTAKEIVAEKIVAKHSLKQYYIIAGSFSSADNAHKLVAELKAKGYNATLADTSSSNMFRVAYESVDGLEPAKEKLYAIRQEDNPDAWILRK